LRRIRIERCPSRAAVGGIENARFPDLKQGEQERVSVGRRIHDQFGADIAGGTRPVLDDERLAEPLRERLADQACSDVGAPPAAKPTMMRTGRVG
jgi:hypothetical protein